MARLPYQTRIALRIEELELQISQMAGELNELRIAQKVLSQLGGEQSSESDGIPQSSSLTIGDRILSILKSFGPQSVQQICDQLAADGHGEVPYNSLSGTLSRLQRKGLVQNLNGKWETAPMEGEARQPKGMLPPPPLPWFPPPPAPQKSVSDQPPTPKVGES